MAGGVLPTQNGKFDTKLREILRSTQSTVPADFLKVSQSPPVSSAVIPYSGIFKNANPTILENPTIGGVMPLSS